MSARAAIVTTPPGLPDGSQYRLAFVTSSTSEVTDTDINTYNLFVSTAASDVTQLNSLGATWLAIIAPYADTFPSDLGTFDVPIYDLEGNLIVASDSNLFSVNSLSHPLDTTELGTTNDTNVATAYGAPQATGAPYYGGYVRIGDDSPGYNAAGFWYNVGTAHPEAARPLYALSSVLTAEAPAPEPGPAVTMLLGAILMLAAARNRAKTRTS